MLVRLGRNNPTGISFNIYSDLLHITSSDRKRQEEEVASLNTQKISITRYKLQGTGNGILKHRDLDSPSLFPLQLLTES